MSTRKTIVKNAGALLVSQLATWLLSLILTVFLPRYLGATAMGKLALAGSLWAIGGIVVNFGMDTYLTKEISRNPARASSLFKTSFLMRIVMHVVVFSVIIAYTFVQHYPADTMLVVALVGISSLFGALVGACASTLQGLERMELMTIANIVGKGVNTVVCIVLLLFGQGVVAVAFVGILATVATLVVQLRAISRLIPLGLQKSEAVDATSPVQSLRTLGPIMLRSSVPYLLSGVFLVAYAQMDIVIISLLVNEKTIGWYGAAGQLFSTLMFVPNVFMTAVFPTLARMFAQAPDALPRVMRKSFDWMLIIGVPIGLGLFVIADALVVMLFGPDFAQSGPILALMGIVLILTYQNMLLGQFLTSTDRQNKWTLIMALAMVVTIALDLVLVPWCRDTFGNGAIGGSLSFMLTEAAMVAYGIAMLPKGSLDRATVWTAARILLAGLVMVGVTWLVRPYFIAVPIIVGAITYGVMIFVLRLVPQDDLAMAQSVLAGLRDRVRARRPSSNDAAKGGR